MTTPAAPQPDSLRAQLRALPNRLTLGRIAICVAFFAILIYCTQMLRLPVDAEGELAWSVLQGPLHKVHAGLHAENSYLTWLFDGAFVLFVLAALTDIADGAVARRYGLETDLGRIFDPFADKIMIIGSFTLLMPLTVYVSGWMVVLVLARELLVSVIRGFAEARGVPFPANFWGKTKMISQSICVASAMLYVGHPSNRFLEISFAILLWLALLATVVSGIVYLRRAWLLLADRTTPPRVASASA